MEKKVNWSEVYNNPVLAKEIGQEVISRVVNGKVYTHDGVYHADEVFCTALLRYVVSEDLKVIRTRNITDLESGFVYDVGGGSFDHHQCNEYRNGSDGIFAAFGKLWCTVGRIIDGLREEAWKEIDKSFVQDIDLTDNTGEMNPVNYFINSMKTNGVDDFSFEAAVSIAYTMLSSIIQSGIMKSKELDEFETEVGSSIIDNGVLELSRHYTIGKEIYKSLGIDWIIFSDNSGKNYTIQAVGNKLLPTKKRGFSANSDIIFTHKGGWIGRTKSKEAALKLIEED